MIWFGLWSSSFDVNENQMKYASDVWDLPIYPSHILCSWHETSEVAVPCPVGRGFQDACSTIKFFVVMSHSNGHHHQQQQQHHHHHYYHHQQHHNHDLQANGTCPLRNPEMPHWNWLFWWFSLMFVGKSMWSPIGTASKFTKHVYAARYCHRDTCIDVDTAPIPWKISDEYVGFS